MDYSFVFASLEMFCASLTLVVSGVMASPVFKLTYRTIVIVGSMAAFATWIETHPRSLKFAVLMILLAVLTVVVTGCASPSFSSSMHSKGVEDERGLFGGDYCTHYRVVSHEALKELRTCVDNDLSMLWNTPKMNDLSDVDGNFDLSRSRREAPEVDCPHFWYKYLNAHSVHYRCSREVKEDRYFLNPAYNFTIKRNSL